MQEVEPQITVFLTTPEAIQFRSFQEFHETFFLMVKARVFDCKNGSITMHFDSNGKIQKIERKDNLFDARQNLT
jgi:hypothetical protein